MPSETQFRDTLGTASRNAFVAPQIAARLKRAQNGTINMLTPDVARQSYGAAGKRGQAADCVRSATGTEAFLRGTTPISFVAPQNLHTKEHLRRI